MHSEVQCLKTRVHFEGDKWTNSVLWFLYGMRSSINKRCLDAVCVCVSVCVCVCAQSLSCVQLLETPQTVCSPPGSSVHGFLQISILERVAISSSRGSS